MRQGEEEQIGLGQVVRLAKTQVGHPPEIGVCARYGLPGEAT